MKILVINGPNLNFLGIREKGIYGEKSYEDLLSMIRKKGEDMGAEVICFQSNHEGAIIDRLQEAYFEKVDGIVINPGAYTHYSYAIHDALKALSMTKVEVHISDVDAREAFRHVSVTLPACDHQIKGHGLSGYLEAMDYIADYIAAKNQG
jgi:3-dehydroquinate dehydratase-2